jgi:hypothetical protein
MTPYGSRPSGCTGHTPFEEELVNAMSEFANSAEAPNFDASVIVRNTRRKRVTAIASIAAVLVVAGGGTALAAAVTNGSHAAKPAAAASTSKGGTANTAGRTGAGKGDVADIRIDNYSFDVPFGGLSLDFAKQQLMKTQLTLGTVSKVPCGKNDKPNTVVAVSPHAPKVVTKGARIDLTLCVG